MSCFFSIAHKNKIIEVNGLHMYKLMNALKNIFGLWIKIFVFGKLLNIFADCSYVS